MQGASLEEGILQNDGLSLVQVRAVADAAVLISVHGADCMNLMFLPSGGSILEIAPTHYGYGYRKVMSCEATVHMTMPSAATTGAYHSYSHMAAGWLTLTPS